MKSWVVTTLTAVACLFAAAPEVSAQYYDEAPAAASKGGAPDAGGGSEAPKKARKSRPRRARRSSSEDYEDTGRRVFTETATARVKTIYDEQGNVVYQKAWDKKTGKEIPVPEAGRDADEDTGRAQRVREASDQRPYGRLRRDEDGEYEERRADPRPSHGKSHHLHKFAPVERKHPYEFSLGVYAWWNVIDGTLSGSGGTEAALRSDERTSYTIDFHNPRVGYSYTNVAHDSRLTGTFVFDGQAFNANAVNTIYHQTLSIVDGFYRFNCYDSRDLWFDFLLGGKLLFVNANVTAPGARADVDATVPLPELGLIGSYTLLDNIKFRGFLKGAFGAMSDSSATVLDSEIEFVYTFPGDREYAFLNQFSLGYKYMMLDFSVNQDAADEAGGSITLDGPFFKYQAMF